MGSKSRSNVATSRRAGGQNSTHSNNEKSKLSVSKDHSSRNPRQMGREANSRSVKNLAKEPHNHSRSICPPTPNKGKVASNFKSLAQSTTEDGQMTLQGDTMHHAPSLMSSLQGIQAIHPASGCAQDQDYFDCAEMYAELKDLPKASFKPSLNKRAKSLAHLWAGKIKEIAIDIPLGQKRRQETYYPQQRRPAIGEGEENKAQEVMKGEQESDELRDLILQDMLDDEILNELFPNVGLPSIN